MSETLILEPDTLWHKVRSQTQHAFLCGALQPILTEYEIIEDTGILFLVRIVKNLARKDAAKQAEVKKVKTDGKPFNPFLPYDENLFVSNISDTHLCLLNKFNVVDHHLLIVTREYEAQNDWLTQSDFSALGVCLAQIDGLGFYNGGVLAGSSQPHKHLQLIPFPFLTEIRLPIDSVIPTVQYNSDQIGIIPSFEFIHAIVPLQPNWIQSPVKFAPTLLEIYYKLLKTVQYEINGRKQTGDYNLLITRDWMMIILRNRDSFLSIGVNSVGFAGALLVRNAEQLQLLKEIRPLNLLKNVAKLK
ncbi:phosphorylase [Chroococcus sp. FPU101]|uniref:ATP adenylyltransferase family protein n=1 Tax=Chroococcus sp. FPU101 TaxID=1974212 RepID=UPI001A8F930D|nr:phosphorylase [Chroococcus sp. FPU101]GFE70740.1 Ap4A phosphorylase II [Chroococcus sp. FPU101]